MFPIIYKYSSACKYFQAVLCDTLSKHCEWHQNQCIYQNLKPLHPCKSICVSNSYILVCKIQVIYCHINHYITDVNPLTSYLFYLMREWHNAFLITCVDPFLQHSYKSLQSLRTCWLGSTPFILSNSWIRFFKAAFSCSKVWT